MALAHDEVAGAGEVFGLLSGRASGRPVRMAAVRRPPLTVSPAARAGTAGEETASVHVVPGGSSGPIDKRPGGDGAVVER